MAHAAGKALVLAACLLAVSIAMAEKINTHHKTSSRICFKTAIEGLPTSEASNYFKKLVKETIGRRKYNFSILTYMDVLKAKMSETCNTQEQSCTDLEEIFAKYKNCMALETSNALQGFPAFKESSEGLLHRGFSERLRTQLHEWAFNLLPTIYKNYSLKVVATLQKLSSNGPLSKPNKKLSKYAKRKKGSIYSLLSSIDKYIKEENQKKSRSSHDDKARLEWETERLLLLNFAYQVRQNVLNDLADNEFLQSVAERLEELPKNAAEEQEEQIGSAGEQEEQIDSAREQEEQLGSAREQEEQLGSAREQEEQLGSAREQEEQIDSAREQEEQLGSAREQETESLQNTTEQ